jgi:D-sedoheptulose 7-phosphate isomerase
MNIMNKKKKPTNSNSIIVDSYIKELQHCLEKLDKYAIYQAVEILFEAYENGKKIFILGNGGSAGIASHMACDLGKGTLNREYDDEKRFKVISLTDNVPVITAFANDLSYEDIFIQQLKNLVEENDVVVALSGSGNSPNILKALKYAKKCKAKTIGFLGFIDGGKAKKLVDCAIIAKSRYYGPCEDIQLILDHVIISWLSKIKHDLHKNPGKASVSVPFRDK